MNRSGYTRDWVAQYNAVHQHPVNRALHAVGIPMIVIAALMGLVSPWVVPLRWPAALLFALGWLLQFVGHWVEGKPPAFLSDWRFLATGLAWWVRKLRGR